MTTHPNSASIPSISWDVVIIGAGAAGLMASLELPKNLKILLLNRNTGKRSSSRWAQGGIAVVTRSEDSDLMHAEDTFRAGVELCDSDAVNMFVKEAPRCLEDLMSLGMEFDQKDGMLSTTLEAAHSCRRVLHVKDRTGRALVEVLQDQVEHRSNIHHRRGVRVTQLWVENDRCLGVQILDGSTLRWLPSRALILATGGGGHLFANTTNPAQACGEGIALAWKAGAALEDLEFVQFHPTALKLDGAPCFLLSEALRGEGAVLVDRDGNSPVVDLVGNDLAPRDQVSRALFQVMRKQGVNHIGLDLKPIGSNRLENRFPSIIKRCRNLGLDPLNHLIPVAPAAHYWMGGIATNLQAQTSMPGLYAVGEVACTGLHGANRLASNSLMECLVFAKQLSLIELGVIPNKFARIKQDIQTYPYELKSIFTSEELVLEINKLRNLVWKNAGVDRCSDGMQKALREIKINLDLVRKEPLLDFVQNQNRESSHQFNEIQRRHLNLILDLYHRQITSSLMLKACLFRTESRGGHYRSDFPLSVPYWKCHSRQKIGEDISTRAVT